MSMKRGRPGSPAVRHGKLLGPDYPQEHFTRPWDGEGSDSSYGMAENDKAIASHNGTLFEHAGIPISENRYDELWEGK